MTRRPLGALVFLLSSLFGCGPAPLAERVDAAVLRAARFLAARQHPDGAWRSEVYGTLRDDPAPGLAVLKALSFAQLPAAQDAVARGRAWLRRRVRPEGTLDPGPVGFGYPVYAASLALLILGRPGEAAADERAPWLALLHSHQCREPLGWQPADPAWGGFGYSVLPPRKGAGGTFDGDLSSTTFALGALLVSGVSLDDPAVVAARQFVERCQNFPDGDGGFFMAPGNAVQNKAGGFRDGRAHSYGSMTADGLRALLRAGLPKDHPRVLAAKQWLLRNASADHNPGVFEGARQLEQDAPYFYWCWSLAHAGRALAEPLPWTAPMAEALLLRQEPDGSFRNRFTMVKEDDPLVATPLALGALALLRLQL